MTEGPKSGEIWRVRVNVGSSHNYESVLERNTDGWQYPGTAENRGYRIDMGHCTVEPLVRYLPGHPATPPKPVKRFYVLRSEGTIFAAGPYESRKQAFEEVEFFSRVFPDRTPYEVVKVVS